MKGKETILKILKVLNRALSLLALVVVVFPVQGQKKEMLFLLPALQLSDVHDIFKSIVLFVLLHKEMKEIEQWLKKKVFLALLSQGKKSYEATVATTAGKDQKAAMKAR
jgi:hypothetical protein